LHRTAFDRFIFDSTEFYVVSQMHLWQRAANASMATCRKYNYGNVPQMHLWQCAANAINDQDRTRVSIMAIIGKPGAAERG
jgi:hypothetical protein